MFPTEFCKVVSFSTAMNDTMLPMETRAPPTDWIKDYIILNI